MAVVSDSYTDNNGTTWEARIDSIDFVDLPGKPAEATIDWGVERVSGSWTLNALATLWIDREPSDGENEQIGSQHIGTGLPDSDVNQYYQSFEETTTVNGSEGDAIFITVYETTSNIVMDAMTRLPTPDSAPEPTATCSVSPQRVRTDTNERVRVDVTVDNPFNEVIKLDPVTIDIGWTTVTTPDTFISPGGAETASAEIKPEQEGTFTPEIEWSWSWP